MTNAIYRSIERVARLSYGKLVARLAARTGGIASAEDALSGALIRALETWPQTGLPDNPEAWLVTVARNLATDRMRSDALPLVYEKELVAMAEEHGETGAPSTDPRLGLMFACAHPSISRNLRAPLMLQTVLGLDAKRMASVFLLSPGTLGQRMTRLKAKIERAGIPFDLPDETELESRLTDVLNAIHAAYAVGYNGIPAGDAKAASLAEEAIWLVSLIAAAYPDAAEAHGLFALMLLSEARRPARTDAHTGALVPLERQDTRLWDTELLHDGETALSNAAQNFSLGRFQLEASIQAAFMARRRTGMTDWDELKKLYAGLVHVSPSIGALVGQAAVLAEAQSPESALAALEKIPTNLRRDYQPWWAVRAHVLMLLKDTNAAVEAFDRAIGLSDDPSTRKYLAAKKSEILEKRDAI